MVLLLEIQRIARETISEYTRQPHYLLKTGHHHTTYIDSGSQERGSGCLIQDKVFSDAIGHILDLFPARILRQHHFVFESICHINHLLHADTDRVGVMETDKQTPSVHATIIF